MGITKEVFGKSNGKLVHKYVLTNENGMQLTLIEMGAVIQSLCVPDKDGKLADVVLGFDNLSQYEKENGDNHGAVVGRNANRIKDAKFVIKGKEYTLVANDGKNNLHSGPDMYSTRIWDSESFEDEEGLGVTFSLVSHDGDQGMPGQLDVTVTYVLTPDNAVVIEYDGVAGDDTIVNMTNHTYFNLAGHNSGDVLNQKVWIDADEFTPGDAGLIPTGEYRAVKGTPMDFNEPKTIGQDIDADYEPLVTAKGYDHNYVLKTTGEDIELVAKLIDERSGRTMEVYTDLPGMQLYTGNFLDGTHVGKGGYAYKKRDGVCFETQFFPDAVNNMAFESPVVDAGVPFNFVTVYKFLA